MDAEDWQRSLSAEARRNRVLLMLRGLLDRVELGNGSFDGLPNLMKGVISFAPIPLVHCPGRENRDTFMRAQRLLDDMEATSNLVYLLYEILEDQVETAKEEMQTLSLRNGISSLPDDILTYILSFATTQGEYAQADDELNAVFEAMSLSHVCRRFRSLILNNPREWNVLSYDFVDMYMALHCIHHAKNAPLNVRICDIARERDMFSFRQIVSVFLDASARWKSLEFGQHRRPTPGEYEEREEGTDWGSSKLEDLLWNISAFRHMTNGHSFPSLTSLRLDYEAVPHTIDLRDEKFHPHHSWSIPSLETFEFSGGIPLPFDNAIKNMSIKYHRPLGTRVSLDLQQIQEFFASCTSLEYVKLQLAFRSVDSRKAVNIPGVKEFHYCFEGCSMDSARIINKAFYFQDATKMTLELMDSQWQDHLEPDLGVLVRELALQHSYDGLKSLEVRFSSCTDIGYKAHFLPPFEELPNLEHIRLSALSWPDVKLRDIPYGVRIPPLRSLTVGVRECEWIQVSKWITTLVARLKEQGGLDRFEELRIQDCTADHDPSRYELDDIRDYLPEHKIIISCVSYKSF